MSSKILYINAITILFFASEAEAQPSLEYQDTTRRSLSTIIEKVKTKIGSDKLNLEMSDDEIIRKTDSLPAFSIYKDNYFISGVSLNETINSETADVKYQISIRHRLTKSHLPFDTFLYLTYTQKSFWDIYAKSAPFRDNNYNPGLGLGRYIIVNNQLTGATFLQLEHESNGQNDEESRDINLVSFSGKYFFTNNLSIKFKVSVPFLIGENNEDILDYRGTGIFAIDYKTRNDKWWFSGMFSPKKSVKSANVTLTAGYKISDRFNQYIFGEFYSGTGDSMLDYKKQDLKLRVGICIKPDFYNVF